MGGCKHPLYELRPCARRAWRIYELERGNHLLIDCRDVSPAVCLDDRRMLQVMANAAQRAGANVISQVRYRFGHDSPPGFTAVVVLDESHCSAHAYADTGQLALDVFTCGNTDPLDVLRFIREEIDLGTVTVRQVPRFAAHDGLADPPSKPALSTTTPPA